MSRKLWGIEAKTTTWWVCLNATICRERAELSDGTLGTVLVVRDPKGKPFKLDPAQNVYRERRLVMQRADEIVRQLTPSADTEAEYWRLQMLLRNLGKILRVAGLIVEVEEIQYGLSAPDIVTPPSGSKVRVTV